MKWEDSIDDAIKLRLAISMPSAIVNVEYMDTKRIDPNQTRLAELKSLYVKKYKNVHFDLIIATNTDAFNFLLNNGDAIFPGTPVVFCGVINFNDRMLDGKPGFTGVVETYEVLDTISLMLHLHPSARHIAIITDQTATGKANRKVVEQAVSNFKQSISFEFLDNMTANELREQVATLPNNSLILLMTFNRDRIGRVLTYEDSSELIRGACSVPVYSVYDFYLGYGVVGGKMISGTSQGNQAADLAIRVLQGEPADKIPVIKESLNLYMFDMFELNRFGVPLTSLPHDSKIINLPFSDHACLIGMNLSGLDLSRTNLSRSELQGANLNGANLSETNLEEAWLNQATLIKAKLNGANLKGAHLSRSDLSGSDLQNTDLTDADLDEANLTGATLNKTRLSKADLTLAKMPGVNLDRTILIGSRINWADLSGSRLYYCQFARSDLFGANLSNSDLTGSDFTRAYLPRADLSGAILRDTILENADITNVNLSGAHFHGTKLDNLNANYADFSGADLTGIVLRSMNLQGTVMRRTKLRSTSIEGMIFDHADLSQADLRDVRINTIYMNNTNLSGADLQGANLTMVVLQDVDLSHANLKGIKYDNVALQSLAGSNLDEAKMDANLQKDLKELKASRNA
jgi:uncharacterized protein YjbI with pentapeptide repeats/ABC-type uncharacterized transport system substrate-binding protein